MTQSKILRCYPWVAVERRSVRGSEGGYMSYLLKLMGSAACKDGQIKYYRYTNDVSAGEWAGGIVGLKSILEIKSSQEAREIMLKLVDYGYINFSECEQTGILRFNIGKLWYSYNIVNSENSPVCTSEGYICVPRNVTQPLIERGVVFSDYDALTDLNCHVSYNDPYNPLSLIGKTVNINDCPILSMDDLAMRWGWSKAKVSRFFSKYDHLYSLIKLPGAYGMTVYKIDIDTDVSVIENAVKGLISEVRRLYGRITKATGSLKDALTSAIRELFSELNLFVANFFEQIRVSKDNAGVSPCEFRVSQKDAINAEAKTAKAPHTEAYAVTMAEENPSHAYSACCKYDSLEVVNSDCSIINNLRENRCARVKPGRRENRLRLQTNANVSENTNRNGVRAAFSDKRVTKWTYRQNLCRLLNEMNSRLKSCSIKRPSDNPVPLKLPTRIRDDLLSLINWRSFYGSTLRIAKAKEKFI